MSLCFSLSTIVRSSRSAARPFSSSAARREHFLSATPEVFDKAIQGERTVLVDFYADWCGPCRFLTPVLKTVVPPESKTDLMTVDTDANQELAARYKIAALPTVIAFKGGKIVGKFVGGRNEAGVKAFLEEIGV